MLLLSPRCPQCKATLFVKGKFGESTSCRCGAVFSVELSDRIRRYWAFQVALPYSGATFLLGFIAFHPNLPSDPWARLFTPHLMAPAFASLIVVRRVLIQRMRVSNASKWLFSTFWIGMVLAGLCVVLAVGVEKL